VKCRYLASLARRSSNANASNRSANGLGQLSSNQSAINVDVVVVDMNILLLWKLWEIRQVDGIGRKLSHGHHHQQRCMCDTTMSKQ
jgi:hypothetical protein